MEQEEMAEILEKAADLYESEQVDWCRRDWASLSRDGRLSVCAEGAIYLASGVKETTLLTDFPSLDEEASRRGSVVIGFLSRVTRLRSHLSLYAWNDSNAENKQAIVDLMKEQAKELRNVSQAPTTT
jgi:hypothetical protein